MNIEHGSQLMEDEGAGYLISVSDLMAGLLFVFIITLMAFVLSYQRAQVETVAAEQVLKSEAIQTAKERDRLQQERDRLETERDRLNAIVDHITNGRRLRAEILERIQRELADLGIRVEVDTEHGILHLTENAVHFPSGHAELSMHEVRKLTKIGGVLSRVVPCYATEAPADLGCEPRKAGKLESVFIEGHTDNVPYGRGGRFDDNWDLSAQRAMFTYRTMIVGEERLAQLENADGFPIFSVSGYGEGRPRKRYDKPTPDAANRRIDLRFIMSPPRKEVAPVEELRGKGL